MNIAHYLMQYTDYSDALVKIYFKGVNMKLFNITPTVFFLFFPCFAIAHTQQHQGFTIFESNTLSATQESVSQSILFSLNKSFNNQENLSYCNGKPDYYCNGVMVSAFEHDKDPYWTSSTPAAGKLSLTYFRKDIKGPLWGDSGFILWPEGVLKQYIGTVGKVENAFKPIYRCIFPLNGNTDERLDHGCGPLKNDTTPPPNSQMCQSQGIITAEKYIDNYLVNPGKHAPCGFALDISSVDDENILNENIKIIKYAKDKLPFNIWNEVIMKPWENDEHQHIPLMAFFYVAPDSLKDLVVKNRNTHNDLAALSLAKYQQKYYYNLTGIFAPIFKISQLNNSVVFLFDRNEQDESIPEIVNAFPE